MNVRRVRFVLMKNVQIYMLFRAAKRVAPIIATTALLNKGKREESLIIIMGERK